MVGENPARGWLLKVGSPLTAFGEQARLPEEVGGHAAGQGIHGQGEPNGKVAIEIDASARGEIEVVA